MTVELGSDANAWIGSSLAKGGPVSAAVLATFDLDTGSAYTVLPAGTEPGDARAFARGGVATHREAAAVLATLRVNLPTGLTLAVEDDLGRPSDPAVKARPWPSVVVDGWVLPWTTLDTDDPNELVRFLNACSSGYPTNAFVLDMEPLPVALAATPIDVVTPQQLVDHVRAIVTAAYDAESFIVWQPSTAQRGGRGRTDSSVPL